ncbi:MAG: chromate transporter [Clostridiales bacterium]|nr:chromate transporter [Clostridiales bacterium]
MKELLQLYCTFFRIGGLTFGGGLTMLPMLKYELIDKKHWVEEEELLNYYAVGQCTPGIIAVNTATFVGYKRKGIPGAIAATLGMVSPSLIIVSILAMFLDAFMSNPYVTHAVAGIKIIVCALMLNTVITMAKKSVVSAVCAGIAIAAFVLAFFSPIPTVLLVIISGAFGVLMMKLGRVKV